jgi:hypothetical protein
MPRAASQLVTPSAEARPKALPPVRTTASTPGAAAAGDSRELSRVPGPPPRTSPDPALPGGALEPAERALVKKLVAFPAEVGEAAERRAPHRIATYALELARDFAAFYETCKVVGTEQEAFRLALCDATRGVLARALGLLGIEAPATM